MIITGHDMQQLTFLVERYQFFALSRAASKNRKNEGFTVRICAITTMIVAFKRQFRKVHYVQEISRGSNLLLVSK